MPVQIIAIKGPFYIFKGILGSCCPLRAASTGLQSCVFLNLFLIEPKYCMVNSSSSWGGTPTGNGSLHTYLVGTGKWAAPLDLSGASSPRGGNVNTLDLSDPQPSHLTTSLPNLPFPFPPLSMTPLVLLSLPFSFSPFSFKWEPDEVWSLPVELYVWGGGRLPKWREEPQVAYLGEKASWTRLDQGWFWTRNSCLCSERWDSFPDITREREGEDGVNSMGKLGRSLGKGWGWKRLPCLAQWFAHGRRWGEKKNLWRNVQCSLEDAEICQTIPGALIWCQPGWRNKIYTYQNEVSNSLAICPSTPLSPPNVFFHQPAVLILPSRVIIFKKGEITAWQNTTAEQQQLGGHSCGGNIGAQRTQQQVGEKEKRDGCGKLFWVGWDRSGQESKSQLKRESAPICLNLPICSEQIHLEVEWGLKQQKLGCL